MYTAAVRNIIICVNMLYLQKAVSVVCCQVQKMHHASQKEPRMSRLLICRLVHSSVLPAIAHASMAIALHAMEKQSWFAQTDLSLASRMHSAYLDGSILANAGSQTDNSIVHSALLQEGAMTDDCVTDFGVHNLGRWQEAWGCVDGRLRIVELKLGWLHNNKAVCKLYAECNIANVARLRHCA